MATSGICALCAGDATGGTKVSEGTAGSRQQLGSAAPLTAGRPAPSWGGSRAETAWPGLAPEAAQQQPPLPPPPQQSLGTSQPSSGSPGGGWGEEEEDADLAAPLSELYDVWDGGYEDNLCLADPGFSGTQPGGTQPPEPEPPPPAVRAPPAPPPQQRQQQQQRPEAAPAEAPKPPATGPRGEEAQHAPAGTSGTAASPPQPEPPAPAVPRLCQVCQADITALHYTLQVTHVKTCLAGRGPRQQKPPKPPPGNGPKKQAAPQRLAKASAPGPAAGALGQAAASPAPLLHPAAGDVKQWLEGLGLLDLLPVFEREEIDMRVAHTLTATDLASIGITDRRTQTRIVAAAHHLAAARGARGGAAAAGRQAVLEVGPKGLACALPVPNQGQATAEGPGRPRPATKQPSNAGYHQQQQQQQRQQQPSEQREPGDASLAGVRPREQALLDRLFPGGGGEGRGGDGEEEEEIRCTPQMPASEAPPAARRVPPEKSLWTCASTGVEVVTPLEARLAQRQGAAPAAAEPLARGCAGPPPSAPAESRASRQLKLAALQEELRRHEETAEELRTLIAVLQAELLPPGAARPAG